MDAYIVEFQRLSVLVTDISPRRLVVLFCDGLVDPLRGWVKVHDPLILAEATKKARDLAPSVHKEKNHSIDSSYCKDRDKKPFQKEYNKPKEGSKGLDNETLNELRKKKLCFHCRENWDLSHKFSLKAKANQMEYFSVEESESEVEDQHFDSDEGNTIDESSIPKDDRSLARLTRAQKEITFKVRGTIQGQKVISPIDTRVDITS